MLSPELGPGRNAERRINADASPKILQEWGGADGSSDHGFRLRSGTRDVLRPVDDDLFDAILGCPEAESRA